MSAEESLFNKFWIEILRRNGEYFLRYDDGRRVNSMVEAQLTIKEATQALHALQDKTEEEQLAFLSALVANIEEGTRTSSPTASDPS